MKTKKTTFTNLGLVYYAICFATATILVTSCDTAPRTAIQTPVATLPVPSREPVQGPTSEPQAQQSDHIDIWISHAELADLPMDGTAWESLLKTASEPTGPPILGDQNDPTNVQILAKALVFARTNEEEYRTDVINALQMMVDTASEAEADGSTLALGRELAAYIIAAELIELPTYAPQLDKLFRNRLRDLLTGELKATGGATNLRETHELRPNNWGTHAGAARLAIAAYLEDEAELARAAQVFKGWLGDRATYAGFRYGEDLSWQCDPNKPVGINPVGCTKDGHDIGGALPEELRRPGEFQWPPPRTRYAWEALQGALVQATILQRFGYDAWEWGDRALLRAVQFLHDIGWEANGDDEWQPWLINCIYGTNFPTRAPANPGKNMGWTDWTHSPQSPLCYQKR